MVLGAVLLAGSTVASLALPFFFPPTTPEPKTQSTIQTPQSKNTGRKILINTKSANVSFPKPKPEPIDPSNHKKLGVIAIIVIIIFIFILVAKR